MIAIVGRDSEDFTARSQKVLDACLTEAGIRSSEVTFLTLSSKPSYGFFGRTRPHIEDDIASLRRSLDRLRPKMVVAMGNEVSHSLVPDWPDTRSGEKLVHRGNIFGAKDIENRRGYVFDSDLDCPVIVTVRSTRAATEWVPWRVLLSFDLQRAKELHDECLRRPIRQVELVTSPRDARNAVVELGRFSRLASDIETWRDTSLACVGFAGESGRAFVFPAQYLEYARELLQSPKIGTIWANGMYDLFCLKHREGVRVEGRLDDCQIGWHSAYPELAGKKEDKRKQKMTRKSLAFLASLCTWDFYWKGDFETDEEFFIYNGKDCCITFDVQMWVEQTLTDTGAWPTYRHEMGLVWPVVDMLERGLYVDEDLRREREEALQGGFNEVYAELNNLVLPLLEAERERLDLRLFEEIDPTCECCGHGTKKQMACWSCAGFKKSPSKNQIVEKYDVKELMSKASLEKKFLPICHVCCGEPRETRLVFNPASNDQKATVLYDVLGLPKKTKKGKLTTDEKAIRSLLGSL